MVLPQRLESDTCAIPMSGPAACGTCRSTSGRHERPARLGPIPDQGGLLAVRSKFMTDGVVPAGVPLPILRSWERSGMHGLVNGTPRRSEARLTETALKELRERNEDLLVSAWGEIVSLCRETQPLGGVVVLTDPNGVVLIRLGDSAFSDEAERLGLCAGGDWSEQAMGTNAIGTALSERFALSVIGAEHFCNGNTELSCSAVPIIDPCGALAGIIDLSTSVSVAHDYSLPLLKRAANEIERRLFERRFGRCEQMHLHSNPRLLGSPNEGLLAFDSDRLVGANRMAVELIGLSWSAIGVMHFRQLFSVQHASVTRQASADECVVQSTQGSTFFARMQMPRKAQGGVEPSKVVAPEPAQPALAAPDAKDVLPHVVLEALQAGGGPKLRKMKVGQLVYGVNLMDETGEAILVVASGQYRCFASHEGKELTLFTLGPGDAVPLQPEMVVEVRKEGEAAVIPRATFRRLTRDHPEFGMCILPAVEKMLNRSLTMVGEMAFRSVRYRLIRYLCEMAEHDGRQTSAGVVIDSAPHGDDLAMAIGAARQSVSTVLAELIRAGDVQRPTPRTFVIPNIESLKEELRVLR